MIDIDANGQPSLLVEGRDGEPIVIAAITASAAGVEQILFVAEPGEAEISRHAPDAVPGLGCMTISMKIIVIGGTGQIGSKVVAQPPRARATRRSPPPRAPA